MRYGRFSVCGGSVVLSRTEDTPDGVVRIEVGVASAEVCAADLIERLRVIGAFAKSKCKPSAVVSRQVHEDAVAVVDLWNRTFPKRVLSVEHNAPFAERAVLAGYGPEQFSRVFAAIRDKRTRTCKWLWTEGKEYLDFEHVTRPPYRMEDRLKPGIPYTILRELDGESEQPKVRRTSTEEI